MKNLIKTLSLAVAFGMFVSVAQPAHADFFDESFQTDTHVTAPRDATPPTPQVSTPQTVEITQSLQIQSPSAGPAFRDWQLDANWTSPLSNAIPYDPMR